MKNKQYLLGIDVGTSSTKVLLCTTDGNIVGESTAAYPLYSPKPGWNEQNPRDWWLGTQKAVTSLITKKRVRKEAVRGIGLSGQMHGSVFLDEKNRPIRRALLWNDQRTQAQCEKITELAGGGPALISAVNNIALTGFTAPKILWLRDCEPENYKRVRHILLPKDYVRLQMTGELATDVADASGTLLLDIKNRCWHRELLSQLEIDESFLPPIFESPEVTGTLTASAAKRLGLTKGIPVVAGAGDQAAGAVGMGVVNTGIVSATIGTSGVVFAHADEMVPNPEGLLQSFCHAVPGKWCVFGCMLSAGGSLEWLRHTLFPEKKGKDVFEKILAAAEKASSSGDAVLFLPYLEGERCPHSDPFARACWIGLHSHHDRAAMARATIEGITFGMADQIQLMRKLGVQISEVRCAGGGAKSKFWRQLQANSYNAKTVTVDTENASALGVALLAGVGTGIWKSVEQACCETIHLKNTMAPQERLASFYQNRHAIYQELYPALKKSFQKLAEPALT